MPATAHAVDFGPWINEFPIGLGLYGTWRNRFPKAWPARLAVKLFLGRE